MTTKGSRRRNGVRNKNFSIPCTDEEYELLHQAAAMADQFGAAWGRDILVAAGLRARWRGQAA
ncbi:hypothetical protein [Microbacterium sp. zg-YB36]|uniref:hypothetical protein n=1 Tax=Microbacterium sp. zg-YB36 TaxID=2969407 RepID=UPI00214AF5E3|nr:hypothetical protein [Microbacterium sp. zg-YB36]MDL5351116.1 hypothetical protein [Microbacterium sp. zg-YB36]